jgi:hypothetical protein
MFLHNFLVLISLLINNFESVLTQLFNFEEFHN